MIGPVSIVTMTLVMLLLPAARGHSQPPVDTSIAAVSQISGASAGDHVWFCTADPHKPESIRLFHHALDMRGPYYRSPVAVPRQPTAMAASGDRVWLFFSQPQSRPSDDGLSIRTDVYTISTRRNTATDLYFYIPPAGLRLLPPLDAPGPVIAAVARGASPVVFVRNNSVHALTPFAAYELTAGAWRELPSPPLYATDTLLAASIIGSPGEPVLLTESGSPRDEGDAGVRTRLLSLSADLWHETALDMSAESVLNAMRIGERLTVQRRATDGRTTFDFIRKDRVIPFATFAESFEPGAVFGVRDGLLIIARDDAGDLTLRSVDRLSGTVSPVIAMRGQPLSSLTTLYLPILLTACVIAMMVAILSRPFAADTSFELPDDVAIAPLAQRGVATLIDFVPVAVVVVLVMRASPEQFLSSPLWTVNVADSLPLLISAVIAAAVSGVTEAFFGRSIGKVILHLRVISVRGGRVSIRQVLLRNLFKIMLYIMPPLVIFAVLNPHRQRLGDSFARTVVVQRKAS